MAWKPKEKISVIQKEGAVFKLNCCGRWLQAWPKQHESTQRSGTTKAKSFEGCKKAARDNKYFKEPIPNFSKTTIPLYVLLKKTDS